MFIKVPASINRRLILAAALVLAVGGPNARAQTAPRVQLDTSLGKIVIELDPAKAPKTVENFLGLVRAGFYHGTIFHRVIPGFMAQGGGFTPDYRQKLTGPSVRNESVGGSPNMRGTVAMARTSDPHSATAQFFVNVVDNRFLDAGPRHPGGFGYTVFGRVVEGIEIADKMVAAPTGPAGPFDKDAPKTPIVITKATIIR
ncbi:MAG: peptidyl-prolyl cis-trans isomerase [Alphaproteobacteria bacterium]|nr:peptidyl-prolyl cis-trans isomerase [Alphaproteobacteria bacterium]MBM3732728.1 peptidyl-prolyl cis-trans isomerase [Acidimicrobiia bacterium]